MGKGKKTKTVHPIQRSVQRQRQQGRTTINYRELEREYLKKGLVLFCAAEYSRMDTSTPENMDIARKEIVKLATYFNEFCEGIENHKFEVKHIEAVLKEDLGLTVGTW